MKIILKDFIYKGRHINDFVCELPQVKEMDETFEERIVEYIKEDLEETIK